MSRNDCFAASIGAILCCLQCLLLEGFSASNVHDQTSSRFQEHESRFARCCLLLMLIPQTEADPALLETVQLNSKFVQIFYPLLVLTKEQVIFYG